MTPNPSVMQAIERLGYRVTAGDVASHAGLDIKLAERDLLALAADAGGHMQVAKSGDIAYLFPSHFRTILRSKFWRLRLKEWWNRIWKVLFYLIRISFGLVLLTSILLIFLTIVVILASINSQNDNDSRGSSSHYGGGFPALWISPDWFWILTPDYYDKRRSLKRQGRNQTDRPLNFLEAIFSFLFGDGNPNANLDDRRWQTIATVIRNNGGAVVAEQIAPYLDQLGTGFHNEYEEYMLPVLVRFNGQPEVSPDGQIIYHFPELQVSAKQWHPQSVAAYLRESLWRFSQASSGQILAAIGLGGVNLIGALMLGRLLSDGTIAAQLGGLVGFTAGIYGFLLAYGIGFLAIPLIRYFWVQWRNRRITARNEQRQERAISLNDADDALKQKLAFAHQFVTEQVIGEENLAYTTTQSLTEQELAQADAIDAEWQRRLEQGS